MGSGGNGHQKHFESGRFGGTQIPIPVLGVWEFRSNSWQSHAPGDMSWRRGEWHHRRHQYHHHQVHCPRHYRQQRRYIQVSTPLPLISSTLNSSPEGLSNCQPENILIRMQHPQGSKVDFKLHALDGTVEIFRHQMKSVELVRIAPKEFDLHAASLDQMSVRYAFRGTDTEIARRACLGHPCRGLGLWHRVLPGA